MAQMGGGDAATARELRHFYGLDLSIPVRLANYLWRLVRLDLGFSSIYGKPVATVILERLPPTISLMTASLSFAFFFGLLFGVIAARGVNKWPDTLISTLGLALLRNALVLVRIDGDRGVFDLSAMAARGRVRRHRHGADRHLADHRYRKTSRFAVADAGPDLPCDLFAHHARLDARGAQPRLCQDRARQGPRRDRRHRQSRATQRAAAHGHPDRIAGRHHAGRLSRCRKRILAAGAWTAGL